MAGVLDAPPRGAVRSQLRRTVTTGRKRLAAGLDGAGHFYAMSLDTFRYTFSRPVQVREFVDQV